MNCKISNALRFFCCFILLTSSINSLENDDNSEEDETHSQTPKIERENSIKDQLKRISVELRQSKERDGLLKVEVERIYETLNELKLTVDEIKLQMNESDAAHDRRLSQLSDEINHLKQQHDGLRIEVNAINKVLRKNKSLEKAGIPFIDFHKCNKSLNIEKDEPTFSWTISDMKKKMNQTSFSMESEIFPLKGYSVKARAALWYGGRDVVCYLSYQDSNKSNDDLVELKIFPSVNYVFKNQSQLGHYNDVIIRENYRPFNVTTKYNKDNYYYENILIRSIYDVSDTVVIDFYVETPEQAEQRCSEDGTITWAIHNVKKGRELEKTEHVLLHASPYFYSGPKGYRMIAAINLNEYDNIQKRWGLIAHTPVISGPYDDDLSKTFKIKSTFTFFHPTDPTKNIIKSMVLENTDARSENIFVANDEVDGVLTDDSLYYQVTTEVL